MSTRMYVAVTLLINGLVPWGIYELLSGVMSSMAALCAATLVPLAENLIHLCKHRKLDAFGSIMLFTFIFALVLAGMGGSERLLLVRESFITGSVGIIFLASLLFKRPVIYYLANRFLRKEGFADNWSYPYFRFVMRLMTLVWGLDLLLEAIVRTMLVYRLSTSQFLALSNVVLYGFIGAALLWTALYRKRSSRILAELKMKNA
ncbi:VC0807 family protein [Paenibacillus sp. y28]